MPLSPRPRRTILQTVATTAALALAGCAARPGGGPASGDSETTATADTTSTTESTTDRASETTAQCEPVATDVDLPDVSRPTPLTGDAAALVAQRLETAYVDHRVGGETRRPGVPTGAELDQYGYRSEATAELADGYRVTVGAVARYNFDGDEPNETALTADRPLELATYRVTDRGVERLEGHGDLTGTLICW